MKKRISVVFSAVALVLAISAPLPAQSWHLSANIPFEFTVAGTVLPAGTYSIQSGYNNSVVTLQSHDTGSAAAVLTHRAADSGKNLGVAELIFNRYGDAYFLSEIWNGYTASGRGVGQDRTERELSRTSSLQKFEIIATLARR